MAGVSLAYDPPGDTLRAFCKSRATCRGLIGPVEGARKVTVVRGEILRRAYADGGRWRWTVIAPEAELEKIVACWKVFAPLPGTWDKPEEWNHLKFSVPLSDGKRDIDLEMHFLARRSVRDLGAAIGETTGVWLADAARLDEECFEAAFVAAGSWPVAEPARPFVICTSRPPPADHWLAQRSDELVLFRQPGGRTAQVENMRGRRPDFYRRMAIGRSPDWVKVNIDGEFGGGRRSATLEGLIEASYRLPEQMLPVPPQTDIR